MAEKILNTRILLKYDTLANWEDSKGILKPGEVAIATVPKGSAGKEVGSVVTPQVLVKVGDGEHTFAQLPYITAKAGDVYAWAKAEKLNVSAFGKDVQELFDNIENDITTLKGNVGNSKVSEQISAAITAALKNLANGDAAKTHEFVTAAVQGEDGKVAVSRRALEAADIPTIEEKQVNGLTEKLGNINTEIAGVKTTATENLAEAKGYADAEVKKLADGQVATNKANIETLMGADTVEGSVAKALKDAKGYTDTEVGNAKTAAATDAQGKADKALADAKAYVAAEIAKVTGGGVGSLSDLETRVGVIEGDYLKEEHRAALAEATAKVAEDLSKEVERAANADSALSGRLETVEAFFEAALEDSDGQQVIDTLKEIQDYIKSDETGAVEMLASIKANADAIGEMPPAGEDGVAPTLVGMIAAAKTAASEAVANEASRAKGEEARIEGLANAAQGAANKAQGEIDALELVVGTPDEGKTIVEMIADAQAAATYNDTEVRGLISTNATNISNEVTRAKEAEKAINEKIGDGLEGGHATLIAAINAANAGVSTNAGNIKKNADAIAAINDGTTGILATAKGYTDTKIGEVNNAISKLGGKVVKTITGDNYITVDSTDVNNVKLSFNTADIVLVAGDSKNLDPAQA